MKFLFDLFPVILFFVTYKLVGSGDKNGSCSIGRDLPIGQDPILLATGVAIAATFVQVGWLLFRRKKIDDMLWVSLAIVSVFGGATLYFRDPSFIQWKPTILYWAFSVFFLVYPFLFGKTLAQKMMGHQISLPKNIWERLNTIWAAFFVLMGAANLVAVYKLSCDGWVSFKLYGFPSIMFVFVIAQAFYLSRYLQDETPEGKEP